MRLALALVLLTSCLSKPSAEAPARQVIATSALFVTVPDLPEAQRKLTAAVTHVGGFVEGSELLTAQKESTWRLRIPSARLDEAVAALSALGDVGSLRTDARDVTDEVVDVEARLTAKRTEETRLLRLLETASATLADVLAVEKELSRVRGEVEELAGQQKRLTTDVAMSSLTVTLSGERLGPTSFVGEIGSTLNGSLGAMATAARLAALALVAVTPWVLPLVLLVLIVRRRRSATAGTR